MRGQAKKDMCWYYGYATAYVTRKGSRYTVALMAAARKTTMAEVVRELLAPAGPRRRDHGPLHGPGSRFYSVGVIRYLQRARAPFLMPVVGRGRTVKPPLGPSGSNVFKQCKVSGWSEYPLTEAKKNRATVRICI